MWSGTLETQNLLQCVSSTAILIVWAEMGVALRYHGYTNNYMISSKNKETGIPLLNLPGQPWIVTKKEQYNSARRKYKAEINDPHTTCCNALRTTHQLQKTVNKFNKASYSRL